MSDWMRAAVTAVAVVAWIVAFIAILLLGDAYFERIRRRRR